MVKNQTILVGGIYHLRDISRRSTLPTHQLTPKGVGYRSLVGCYATGRQMEACDAVVDGHRFYS